MVLNGPNLNLLGTREPHIYGTTTLEAVKASCEEFARFAGARLAFHQSNHEGVLVDLIHRRAPGGRHRHHQSGGVFLHVDRDTSTPSRSSRARSSRCTSRTFTRATSCTGHSKLSSAVRAVICGAGNYGYIIGMQAALQMLGKLPESLPAPLQSRLRAEQLGSSLTPRRAAPPSAPSRPPSGRRGPRPTGPCARRP